MGAGYWLLSMFLAWFLFSADMTHRDATRMSELAGGESQQHARQTVQYINLINDWLYDHPQSSGVIRDADLGFTPYPGLKHVISDGRVWVYQPDARGLSAALAALTRGSALLGRVSSRRLTDNQGNDMRVTVPAVVPDASLVYLN